MTTEFPNDWSSAILDEITVNTRLLVSTPEVQNSAWPIGFKYLFQFFSCEPSASPRSLAMQNLRLYFRPSQAESPF